MPYIVSGAALGLGSGRAVAASEASAAALRDAGIAVLNLNDVVHIPCYFDGADEIDASIAMIKGEGAALTREKIIASASGKFICLIDAQPLADVCVCSKPSAVEITQRSAR